jgi:hypothetical protein
MNLLHVVRPELYAAFRACFLPYDQDENIPQEAKRKLDQIKVSWEEFDTLVVTTELTGRIELVAGRIIFKPITLLQGRAVSWLLCHLSTQDLTSLFSPALRNRETPLFRRPS